QNTGVELVDVVDRDGVHVRAVGVHYVQDGHARVVARHQAAGTSGEKHDAAVGQVGGGDVVLPAHAAFVAVAGGRGIAHAPQPAPVHADLVDARVAVGLALE